MIPFVKRDNVKYTITQFHLLKPVVFIQRFLQPIYYHLFISFHKELVSAISTMDK